MEHGEDLIVIIDGVAQMGSKSCSYEVDADTLEVSGPKSGKWKEYKSDRKSWKVTTNHLLYAGTKYREQFSNHYFFTINATNSIEDGWTVQGKCVYNENTFNDAGMGGNGFTCLKINFQTGELIEKTSYGGFYPLKTYLSGSSFDTPHIGVLIFTKGYFILEDKDVQFLSENFNIPLPQLRYGSDLGDIGYEKCTYPLIMLGGKDIKGESYTNVDYNSMKITFDYGELQTADGRTRNVEMVGKKVSLMFKGEDGSLMAGEAICKKWKETDTKGNLTQGVFSWLGCGELQTNVAIQPRETLEKTVDRIVIDTTKTNPLEMITGDVNGKIIQQIRANTHRYLGKYAIRNGSTKMYLIKLDDANSLKYWDGRDVSWGESNVGDWFVMMPQFWTKAEEISTGLWKIGFRNTAPGQSDTGWQAWGGSSQLIGAFQALCTDSYDSIAIHTGSASTGCLRSMISNGDTPWKGDSYDNLITSIGNRNSGFSLVRMQDHNIMAILFMAMYGTTDCQSAIGYGGGMQYAVGQTYSAGMQDVGTLVVNFMGLEAWWGGINEYMQGVHTSGTTWTIGSRTVQAGVTPSDDYDDPVVVFPKRMVIGDNLDMLPYPTQTGGVYNQGFCDGMSMSLYRENVARGRTANDYAQTSMGIFALTNLTPDSGNSLFGTRIAFSGTTQIITNPTTFEALTAIG